MNLREKDYKVLFVILTLQLFIFSYRSFYKINNALVINAWKYKEWERTGKEFSIKRNNMKLLKIAIILQI